MDIFQYITKAQRSLFTFLLTSILISVFGCSGESGYKSVDFSKTVIVERPQQLSSDRNILRVAVAAMISPRETFIYYQELLDYVGHKLGYDIVMIQKKTYGEINEMFQKGLIDVAFLCTGPYVAGKDIYGFEALASPIIRGKPFYHSYLIVNKNSSFSTLEDLKKSVFAFTDPESNTGALVPIIWLSDINETPDSFFSETTYTYSHDNSIMAVAKNLVNGAAVDGHIWEYYNRRNPFYTNATRVIKKSKPFGSPPLVVSKKLSQELKSKISFLLLNMNKDTEGQRILKELMIDRFDPPKWEWYQPVREMYQQLKITGNQQNEAQES